MLISILKKACKYASQRSVSVRAVLRRCERQALAGVPLIYEQPDLEGCTYAQSLNSEQAESLIAKFEEDYSKTFESFFDNFNASWANGDVMVFQHIPVLNDAAKHLIKIGRIKEVKYLSPNQVIVIPGAEVQKHAEFLNDLVIPLAREEK